MGHGRGMKPTETEEATGSPLSNPSLVIGSVSVIAQRTAAARWLKVGRLWDRSGHSVSGLDRWALKDAATWAAIALFIAASGFLLGRFTGEL